MHGTPFTGYYNDFIKWLERLGYAMTTVTGYKRQLETFLNWLGENHIAELSEVKQSDIEAYSEYLHKRKNKQSSGALSSCYIQSHINIIRLLSRYLELTGEQKLFKGKIYIEQGADNPRNILTQQEIKQLYEVTDNSALGYRDRAMLALHYGCGLRYGEGKRLRPDHFDYNKQLLYVKPGKNYQSRYVPMSRKVIQDLKEYEQYGRPVFEKDHSESFLLNRAGNAPHSTCLGKRLKYLCETAGIQKQISLHSLRHSIATHFLQQGMSLEHISKFLGHTSLDSTQIYTRIAEELSQ